MSMTNLPSKPSEWSTQRWGLLAALFACICVIGTLSAADSPHDQYEQARKALKEDDEAGFRRLSSWCRDQGLADESRQAAAAATRISVKRQRVAVAEKPSVSGYKRLIDLCVANGIQKEAEELRRESFAFEYGERRKKLKPGSATEVAGLAKWCQRSGLNEECRHCWRDVIAIEADNLEAHTQLGELKFEGIWQSPEQIARAYVGKKTEERSDYFAALSKAGSKRSRAELDAWVVWQQSPKGTLQHLRLNSYTQDSAWHHLRVPDTYDAFGAPAPLVVALHGGGHQQGDADNVFGIYTAMPCLKDAIIVAPTHLETWWPHPQELCYLVDTIDEVMRQYRIDRHRIYVSGYSMGGMGTWALSSQCPEIFAAAAPFAGWWASHIGAPIGSLDKKHIYIVHGTQDSVVPISGAREAFALLTGKNADIFMQEVPCGHPDIPQGEMEKAMTWLLQFRNEQEFDLKVVRARTAALPVPQWLGGK